MFQAISQRVTDWRATLSGSKRPTRIATPVAM